MFTHTKPDHAMVAKRSPSAKYESTMKEKHRPITTPEMFFY